MNKLLKFAIYMAAFFTFSILFFIILYIVIRGIGHIDLSLFSLKYTTENLSLVPAAITTIWMTFLSLIIAFPIGVFSAIYLVEYTERNNVFVRIINLTIETLAAIPSIVYGLFGLLFFVTFLNLGFSLISGSLTSAIMVLPLVIKTTEEALLSIPKGLREASLALGAGKSRTIFSVVLPAALPGIVSGLILAIGRIVGETAAFIYTAGTVPQIPRNLFSSGRTLAVHMYTLSGEGINTGKAYATGVILMVVILFINYLSTRISKRIIGGK